MWAKAKEVISTHPWPSRRGISGSDFSDTVELWWIMELGRKADTVDSAIERYALFELTTGTPTPTPTLTPTPTVTPPPPPPSAAIRVEMEDFELGGFSDTTPGNRGGAYRSTDVDIGVSSQGGFYVGWIASEEYLEYLVNIPAQGTYNFDFSVASARTGVKTFHIEIDDVDVSGPVNFDTKGAGWQSWQTVTAGGIRLNAGTRKIRIVFETGRVNFDYFDISLR